MPASAGTPVGGLGTCVGLFTLTQTAIVRSSCPAVSGLDRTLIVEMDGGRYRARRVDGRSVDVRRASRPDL